MNRKMASLRARLLRKCKWTDDETSCGVEFDLFNVFGLRDGWPAIPQYCLYCGGELEVEE